MTLFIYILIFSVIFIYRPVPFIGIYLMQKYEILRILSVKSRELYFPCCPLLGGIKYGRKENKYKGFSYFSTYSSQMLPDFVGNFKIVFGDFCFWKIHVDWFWLRLSVHTVPGQGAGGRDPADPPAEPALQRSRALRGRDPLLQRQGLLTVGNRYDLL